MIKALIFTLGLAFAQTPMTGPCVFPYELNKSVIVNLLPTPVFEALKKVFKAKPKSIAFAVINKQGYCVLYIPFENLNALCHEIRHCYEGKFHD